MVGLKPPYPPGSSPYVAGTGIDVTGQNISLDVTNTDTIAAVVDADLAVIGDSGDAFAPKKALWSAVKAYILSGLGVTVPEGGTGVATLTEHGVVIGNGIDPVNVTSAGVASQFLMSNGPLADPTFEDLPTGLVGSLRYIKTVSQSGVAAIDVEDPMTDYKNYVIIGRNIRPSVNNQPLLALLKLSGSYIATNTYDGDLNGASYTAQSNIILTPNQSNDATLQTYIVIHIPSPSSALTKSLFFEGFYQGGSNSVTSNMGAAGNRAVTVLTGIRLFHNSGNITGEFALYGIEQ